MSDRYAQLVNTSIGRALAPRVGLPRPVELDRYELGQPVIEGRVLFGQAPGGRLAGAVAQVLAGAGAEVATPLEEPLRTACADAGLDAGVWNPDAPSDDRAKALVFDATGIDSSDRLSELYEFFHPTIRRVERCGRVIVLGTPPDACGTVREATAQRALEGFARAVGKELREGATAQTVLVAPGAEEQVASTLRFFLSPRSAYVSGQVVRINPSPLPPEVDWEQPLSGRVALVTGAARGIGESIAETLARDGAHVVGLDVPALTDELHEVVRRIGGSALELDITDAGTPNAIAAHFEREHGGIDVVIHNAGITRDKTLGRMAADQWDLLMDINLSAAERIDDALLDAELVRENGRIVGVSSISGIAGNAGQVNYSTSKAGVIGRVQALAVRLADRGITANAVAPGFIETRMTASMPIAIREAGRRMNQMRQGGLPVDVAETIGWMAGAASGGVTGNVVRVCGQSLIGA